MESKSKYYKRMRAQFLMTAFCIIAAAVLFVPSFPAFEQEEDNVYEVRLNGEAVGLTEHPEEAEELLAAFEEDISSYGIGSVPEIYDGDPPHAQRGAISQAWSVGALLRIRDMIDYWKERE